VKNAYDQTCHLFQENHYIRQVAPNRLVLVCNLPVQPFHLALKCGEISVGRDLAPLDPAMGMEGGLQTVVVPGDEERVVDRTAVLVVDNPSRLDLAVSLAGETLGNVFAHGRSAFNELPVGPHDLTFTEVSTRGGWSMPVELKAQDVTIAEVSAPYAALTIFNDCQESVSVVVHGEQLRLQAGEKRVLDSLPPGKLNVRVRFLDSGRVMEVPVELEKSAGDVFRLSSQAGNLAIENRMGEQVALSLDKEEFAELEAGAKKLIRGLAPGKVVVRATAGSGKTMERQFVVSPGSTETWIMQPGNSQLMVKNLIGETAVLHMDGRRLLEMEHLAVVRFPVEAGEHLLTAECRKTGYAQNKEVAVPGGELVEVYMGPQGGRLLVDNRTGEPLWLYRNGRPLSLVRSATAVEYSGQPLGASMIEALNESGVAVVRQRVEIRLRSEGGAQLKIDTTGIKVLVRNETGEPIKVDPAARTETRVIEPGAAAEVSVEGVDGIVKFLGKNTNNRYDKRISGRPGEVVDLVLLPVKGGLAVENATGETVDIWMDRELIATLTPGESMFRDRVPPGQHVLVAKRAGGEETVEEVSCRIIQDSWYAWKLAEKLGALKVLNKTSEDLRIFREGAEAGVLVQGNETVFNRLPERAVTVSAIGVTSNQFHRFTTTPEPGKTVNWLIESVTGGVKLYGFEGSGAAVFVDDVKVADVEAGAAEPFSLPLKPGAHVVKVVLPDGRARGVVLLAAPNLFSTMWISGNSPEVEVRNETTGDIEVLVDDSRLATLAAGTSFIVLIDRPGSHTVLARTPDGIREWLLKDAYLPRQGRFLWILAE